MNINFKSAEKSDLDLLVGMMSELYRFDEIPFDHENARNATARLLGEESRGRIWLIRVEEETAGYVVLTFGYSIEFHGPDALIDELYLDESYRGRGIGRTTLEFIDEFCRSHGIDAVHLEVERHNTRARSLYQKTGFQEHDRYFMTRWVRK